MVIGADIATRGTGLFPVSMAFHQAVFPLGVGAMGLVEGSTIFMG